MDSDSIRTGEDASSVVKAVLGGLEQLRDAELFRFTRDEVLDVGRALESVGRLLYAAQVSWVGEVLDAGIADQLSYSSPRMLLREVLRIGSGDAADRVRAAEMTQPRQGLSGAEIPARLPQVGAALADGRLGAGQVAVITKAAHAWPADLDPDTFDAAEKLLVIQAQQCDPRQLTKIAQRLELILDPEGPAPDPEDDPSARMELHLGNRNPRTGLTPITGTLCDEAVEIFRQATSALAAPAPAEDGTPDRRPPATRLAQAHLAVLRGFLDAGTGPVNGGAVPHITMVIDYDALTGALGNAALDYGGPISIGQARRLLCEAQITPAVLGGDSQILDLGRSQRLFPPHLRKALALRDGGCAWPGCDRPPGWCQAHHIREWLKDLGPTELDNGVLLCSHHHRQAHHSGWQIRIAADRKPDFIPPTHLDPQQRPQRNQRLRR